MVSGRIEELGNYIEKSDYAIIKSRFLNLIDVNMKDGDYPIDGQRIFARVMSYETKDPQICRLEAHNKYIDIQCTIEGAEGIDVYKRSDLDVIESYDDYNDVAFFKMDSTALLAHTNNYKGYFALLFPDEVHAPQQRVGDVYHVKKFVIKYLAESYARN